MNYLGSSSLLDDSACHSIKRGENVPHFVDHTIFVTGMLPHRHPKPDIHTQSHPRTLHPEFSICFFLLNRVPNFFQTGIHRYLQSQPAHAQALSLGFDIFLDSNLLVVFELSPPMTFYFCDCAVVDVNTLFVNFLSVLLLIPLDHVFQILLLVKFDRFLRFEFVHKHEVL